MKFSILIVTKNREKELEITLEKLLAIIDLTHYEVLVFIDGCVKTQQLMAKYDWVQWSFIEKSISASPARNLLYKKAKGEVLIGLDDDAHPLSDDFFLKIKNSFLENPGVAIIAFQEVKGVFISDKEALQSKENINEQYLTNDFIGCGFAIRNAVYKQTAGFPLWIDIYGEESCLAIEVLDLGYDILYNNEIIVNHRIDRKQRLAQGRNYFRFEKQLKNAAFYYLVYYPKPVLKIIKLFFHNFKKYALTDKKCFSLFFKSAFTFLFNMPKVLKLRKPITYDTLSKIRSLRGLKY